MLDMLAHIAAWVLAVIFVVTAAVALIIMPFDRSSRSLLGFLLTIVWMGTAIFGVLYLGDGGVTAEGFAFIFVGATVWTLYCSVVVFFQGRRRRAS